MYRPHIVDGLWHCKPHPMDAVIWLPIEHHQHHQRQINSEKQNIRKTQYNVYVK